MNKNALNSISQILMSRDKPLMKIIAIVIVIIAAAFGFNNRDGSNDSSSTAASKPPTAQSSNPGPAQTAQKPSSATNSAPKPQSGANQGPTQVNGYQKLTGVRLVDHRNNDGDSFFVNYDGDQIEMRLYFVDTAEKYLSNQHASQRKRVQDQADYFGLSVDQTVTLGKAAKTYVLRLLEGKSLTLYTNWEEVYDSGRYHAFVELPDPDSGKTTYLTEILTRKGLGRIHTGGAKTPDGRGDRQYRDYLRSLEKQAKAAKQGAWGM